MAASAEYMECVHHKKPHEHTGSHCGFGENVCKSCIPYKKEPTTDGRLPGDRLYVKYINKSGSVVFLELTPDCLIYLVAVKHSGESSFVTMEYKGEDFSELINVLSLENKKEPTVPEVQQQICRENTVAGALHYDIEVQGRRIDAYAKKQVGFDERLDALETALKSLKEEVAALEKKVK